MSHSFQTQNPVIVNEVLRWSSNLIYPRTWQAVIHVRWFWEFCIEVNTILEIFCFKVDSLSHFSWRLYRSGNLCCQSAIPAVTSTCAKLLARSLYLNCIMPSSDSKTQPLYVQPVQVAAIQSTISVTDSVACKTFNGNEVLIAQNVYRVYGFAFLRLPRTTISNTLVV